MAPILQCNRRQFIYSTAALAAGLALPASALSTRPQISKPIAKSGELLPVIGMGTSRTFDARGDAGLLADLQQVSSHFFAMGGSLIDSSPMYGSSEQVLGEILTRLQTSEGKLPAPLFAASKVWTRGRQQGIDQMEQSRQQWQIARFDLMQIHNLVDWQTQLETLLQMKAEQKIRYVGITTSHGRDHQQLAGILANQPLDFVQLSYNIADREVEKPLLALAQDKGIAVLVNRPYQRGQLFRAVKGKPLPSWAADFECESWGQYFLKFCVSHPAVTCAIPATSKLKHLEDNMLAGKGRLPNAKQRQQMLVYFESL